MKTIGDLIQNEDATEKQAEASHEAARQADEKLNADVQAMSDAQAALAKGLAKTGPITVPKGDGSFATYEPSTSSPGYRVETSKGADAQVDDDPEPVPDRPAEPDSDPTQAPTTFPAM